LFINPKSWVVLALIVCCCSVDSDHNLIRNNNNAEDCERLFWCGW